MLLHLPQEHVVNACHSLALAGQVLSVHLHSHERLKIRVSEDIPYFFQPSNYLCIQLFKTVMPNLELFKCFKNCLNLHLIALQE